MLDSVERAHSRVDDRGWDMPEAQGCAELGLTGEVRKEREQRRLIVCYLVDGPGVERLSFDPGLLVRYHNRNCHDSFLYYKEERIKMGEVRHGD